MRTAFAFVLVACSSLDAAPPSGPDVTEARTIGAVHALHVTAIVQVDVVIGPTTHLELRGPKDWLGKLHTDVANGELTISMPGQHRHVPELHAILTTPELASVDVSGIADVHVATLAAKTFAVSIAGVGSVELAGTADALTVEMSGTGQLKAKQLVTRQTSLAVPGTGHATIDATQEVDITISGVGDVTVFGNPATVHKHVTGVADVHAG